MAYRDEVLADTPLAYWRLGDAAGVAVDEKGAHNGTYQNAPIHAPGLVLSDPADTAIQLNGSNQWITNPNHADFQPVGAFAIEAWIRPGAVGIVQRFCSIKQAAVNNGWGLGVNTVNGLRFTTFGLKDYDSVAGVVAAGTTYHIVAVFNANKSVDYYVNGALLGNVVGTTQPTISPAVFAIGQRGDGAEFFNGVVDEVALYGAALPIARVQAHYTAATAGPPATTVPLSSIKMPKAGAKMVDMWHRERVTD